MGVSRERKNKKRPNASLSPQGLKKPSSRLMGVTSSLQVDRYLILPFNISNIPSLTEHWLVVGALSSVQASCPCSSKIIAGLEMESPAHEKKKFWDVPEFIQSFGQERNRIIRRTNQRKAYIMKNE